MTTAVLTSAPGCPSGLSPPSQEAGSDLSAFVHRKAGNNSLLLMVRGAKCGGCLSKIERAVQALPGVSRARLNLSNGKLDICWTGGLNANDIGSAVTQLGYAISAYVPDQSDDVAISEERSLLISMGLAGFAAANIMLLSVSIWAGHGEMGSTTRTTLHALSGVIALPVLVFAGRHFFASAWSVLRHGRTNMDVPISLALVLAFGVSVFETLNHGQHAYFDAGVMLLFFLLIGRFLDARLRRQAHAAANSLAALQNRSVQRISPDGRVVQVRADTIDAGDEVLLSPGERAVIDMRLQTGSGTIDESLVTGESLPRTIAPGATIYAGSINLDRPVRGIALGRSADSLLSDIASMLEAGEQQRSRYRKIADRAVTLYVPFVHTTALLAFLVWLLIGAELRDAVMIAVTTLIITCPCALALAAPVAQVVAAGKLFKHGIYLRSGDALERFAEIDHVVFDKTGTLTLGTPKLISAHGPELERAATLARASRHPLSRAIVAAAGAGPVAQDVVERSGAGLETTANDVTLRLGSAKWLGVEDPEASDGPSLWFAVGNDAPIAFRFRDELRGDAKQAVSTMQRGGLSVEILSGDRETAVRQVALSLGLDAWRSEISPTGKADRLKVLADEGRKVLMVGDGLNDAGALSLAHAAMAPGGAMDITQSTSDAVFSGGLTAINRVLAVSGKTKRIMLQNFWLAAGYNLIAVPIAVTGHVTPLIAAIAMSASSLIVTLNALRINSGSGE